MKKILLMFILILSILILPSCDVSESQHYSIYQVCKNDNSVETNKVQLYLESIEINEVLLENVPDLASRVVNITPPDLEEVCSIYRFPISGCGKYNGETLLLYNNQIHHLGVAFGGYGITEFAYSQNESRLYYIYSFGSGIHRSCLDYFDFEKEMIVPSLFGKVNEQIDSFTSRDVSFKLFNEGNTLGLVYAEIIPSADWFSFNITQEESYKEDISILFPKEK